MEQNPSNMTPLSKNELCLKLIVEIEKNPNGVTQEELEKALPGVSLEVLAECLSSLSHEGRVNFLTHSKTGEIIYKAVPLHIYKRLQELTPVQQILYKLIEQSQQDGVWTRHLRTRSNLSQSEFNKALKSLEAKKLIKAFKSVTAKNKKFYILYELEPAPYHKGGLLYTPDGDFDKEFADVMTESIYRFIEKKQFASLNDIHDFIVKSQISKVEVDLEHVQKFVDALIYDDKIESFRVSDKLKKGPLVSEQANVYYRKTRVPLPENGLAFVPCGICPVFDVCSDDGDISPAKCQYFNEFLSF
jgi:DNA-directed RNA polymerase III subunit RPC6